VKIYHHRRNKQAELEETPTSLGVEIDLRSWGSDLILEHEPCVRGETFADWIRAYRHSGLILNVKEEGLEGQLLEIMGEQKVTDFFFLDQSYPFMVKWLKAGLGDHIAARVSEYESLRSLESLPSAPKYIWCDSFTGEWGHLPAAVKYARETESSIVIVSPELQARNPENEVNAIKNMIDDFVDGRLGVCTKSPGLWQ
jgi:hypothetical protein